MIKQSPAGSAHPLRVMIADHTAAENNFAFPDIVLQLFVKVRQPIHDRSYRRFAADRTTARGFGKLHPDRFSSGFRAGGVIFGHCRAAKRQEKQKRKQGKI